MYIIYFSNIQCFCTISPISWDGQLYISNEIRFVTYDFEVLIYEKTQRSDDSLNRECRRFQK